MPPIARMRPRPRQTASQRPRSDTSAGTSKTSPPMNARHMTAAVGDQPASSSGLMTAPDMPNARAANTAMTSPVEVDRCFMAAPDVMVYRDCYP